MQTNGKFFIKFLKGTVEMKNVLGLILYLYNSMMQGENPLEHK